MSLVKAGLHLKRPCLLVSDLERSLQLYRDILGFRLDYVGEASPESYLYTVFQIPAQARLTFAALSTEHESRALALTEVKGVALPERSPPHAIGIVIQVSDVPPIIDQVKTLGLTIVAPSYFTAPPNLKFIEQGFHDFDGQLIVLYETKTG
ncbi:MAG: VOC family protein [Cyanobacteria bacterium J06639_14]